ncbi:MAG: archaetidylserine decarboxylase [Pseudomonadales bacterium]
MSEAFAALQRALPQHTLTRLVGKLAHSEAPLVKDTFIRLFARAYDISLDQAEVQSLAGFPSFNAFFTRALRADARPIDSDPSSVTSPADGSVSQCGNITQGALLQAKGTHYSLDSLVGSAVSKRYEGGRFITVYLAPSDYHRYHLPLAGKLIRSRSIPGALFSVNAKTEAAISDLFCRNERLVCTFETAAGPMLMIMVGALIVGAIDTVFGSPPSPYVREASAEHDQVFTKGEELGRFLLGSTVIVCLPPGSGSWRKDLVPGTPVRMGEAIGSL